MLLKKLPLSAARRLSRQAEKQGAGEAAELAVSEPEAKTNDANTAEAIAGSNGVICVTDAVLLPPGFSSPAPQAKAAERGEERELERF